MLEAILSLLVLCWPAAQPARAVPPQINHEGLVLDEDGLPMEGQLTLRFSIYDRAERGNPLWFEEYQLQLIDGYYQVRLGDQNDISGVFDSDARYLAISVNHGDELTPRQRLTSVPYALVAGNVHGEITPSSIRMGGQQIIDENGNWVGPPVPGAADSVGYDTPEEVVVALRSVDGAGSQVDADMLDGLDSSEFVRGANGVLDLLKAVDGSGSGVDADRLDGIDSLQFVSTAEQVRELLLEVDGSGSNVDADLLDGQDSSHFVSSADQVLRLLTDVDGSGSGLDADRIDGADSSRLMRSDQDTGTTGDLFVEGSLEVSGDQSLEGQLTTRDLRVQAGGSIGVGVDPPQAPLDVSGDIRASGTLTIGRVQASHGIRVGAEVGDCQDGMNGMLRWTEEALEICHEQQWHLVWAPAPPCGLGTSQEEAAPSCRAIREQEPRCEVESGVYWINPNGGGNVDAFQIYCDMSAHGGGWALVAVKHDGVIKPQTLRNHSYNLESWHGNSIPDSGNHIYQSYERVAGTEVRVVDTTHGYDAGMTVTNNPMTLRDFFDQNCYVAVVTGHVRFVQNSVYLHICTSTGEGRAGGGDGEAVLFGFHRDDEFAHGDYYGNRQSYSSFDSKATWMTHDNYHYDTGDVQVWIR